MNTFTYEYPIKTYFGTGVVGQHLKELVYSYGRKVLLAYGGGSVKKTGVYGYLEPLHGNIPRQAAG